MRAIILYWTDCVTGPMQLSIWRLRQGSSPHYKFPVIISILMYFSPTGYSSGCREEVSGNSFSHHPLQYMEIQPGYHSSRTRMWTARFHRMHLPKGHASS